MNDALRQIENQLSAKGLAEYIALLERGTGPTGSVGTSSSRVEQFVAEQHTNWLRAMHDLEIPEAPDTDQFLQAMHGRTAALHQVLQEQLNLTDVSSAAGWEQLITHLRTTLPAEAFSGFFVKPEVIAAQLRSHPPHATLAYLGYADIDSALQHESVFELMAALRFSESEDWMEDFLQTYAHLQPDDFAERPVEFLMLDPEKWWKLAEPFATKKKHHFSHLKELGVVFSYPAPFLSASTSPSASAQSVTSSATLHVYISMVLHYIFEVKFYANFFRANIHQLDNFGQAFIEILKGDANMCATHSYQLPIIQQYHLKKPNPNPCVFQPHVMPEVLHWHKARQALLKLIADHPQSELFEFWNSCYTVGHIVGHAIDYVGGRIQSSSANAHGRLLTLNFADNILSREEVLTYHFKEDLWNQLFILYASEPELEQAIIQNFAAKIIDLRTVFP